MLRIHPALMLLAAAAAVLLLGPIFGLGVAHAAADPLTGGLAAGDGGLQILQDYGPLWGGMYLGYGIASAWLAREGNRNAWLAQGRRLAIVTIALGIVGSALKAHLGGAAWSGVAFTAILSAFKLLMPTVQPVPAKSDAPGGFAEYGLMVFLALAGLVALGASMAAFSSGCSGAQKAAEKQALSCTEDAAINDLKPTVVAILSTGVASWEQQLEALGVAFGKDALACAVIAAEGMFTSKMGAGSGTDSLTADAAARARKFIADHGYALPPPKTGALSPDRATRLSNWLGAGYAESSAPGCESPNALPAVDCRPFQAMKFDGCHWACASSAL